MPRMTFRSPAAKNPLRRAVATAHRVTGTIAPIPEKEA